MPWPDGFFDGAVCSLALRHLSSLDDAFREVRRVLDRGIFVLSTSTPEQMTLMTES